MLEEDLEDFSMRELAYKIRIMSIKGPAEDSLIQGLKRMTVSSTSSDFERPKEAKLNKFKSYYLPEQVKFKSQSSLYGSSTLDELARMTQNKR